MKNFCIQIKLISVTIFSLSIKQNALIKLLFLLRHVQQLLLCSTETSSLTPSVNGRVKLLRFNKNCFYVIFIGQREKISYKVIKQL
jgi:hypothetical protein